MATQTAPRPKKKAPARRARSASAKTGRRGAGLPAWGDLKTVQPSPLAKRAGRATAGAKQATKRAAKRAGRARPLDAVPSLRFGLLVLLGCLVATLFVSHVYATRATLGDLQDARRENERLRLTHQRLQGEVDQMVGPSVVMRRAAALGLEEGVAYGPPIKMSDE
ncbi:hypothetical protein RQM47_03595 [Rubrivirga sp. S365]|uniref:Cell division protein FtsL n=1 Tax=Rubrivirga litoralis TaxID=3075598 RepID=A0ABU3BLP5_9BACT|nr:MULTISPECIES: hypothetical protein [unclassified Rubrivirga]MDT0630206.1 hypothetical protein [Rubrivirga sp. F394]MDT7855717.1 hypothetical protein [Rubrivirga sp. S365]